MRGPGGFAPLTAATSAVRQPRTPRPGPGPYGGAPGARLGQPRIGLACTKSPGDHRARGWPRCSGRVEVSKAARAAFCTARAAGTGRPAVLERGEQVLLQAVGVRGQRGHRGPRTPVRSRQAWSGLWSSASQLVQRLSPSDRVWSNDRRACARPARSADVIGAQFRVEHQVRGHGRRRRSAVCARWADQQGMEVRSSVPGSCRPALPGCASSWAKRGPGRNAGIEVAAPVVRQLAAVPPVGLGQRGENRCPTRISGPAFTCSALACPAFHEPVLRAVGRQGRAASASSGRR